MSYRIVKITTYYRDFLKGYYGAHPHLPGLSYADQYSHLMAQAFGWSDYYAKNLQSLGIDAHEIVANAEPLQNSWAREHGLNVHGKDIVLEQIKSLKPDVVFFQDSLIFNSEWIAHLKKEVPSIKLAIGWCCTIFSQEHLKEFHAFDWMFVCSDNYVKEFTKHGLKTYLLRHAFEESLLKRIPIANTFPQSDCIFLGSFIPGAGFHDDRQVLVEKILKAGIHMDLYANITSLTTKDLFLRRSAYIVTQGLKKLGLGTAAKKLPYIQKAYVLTELPRNFGDVTMLEKNSKPPIYGLDMFKALSRANIGLNIHGEIAGEYAANVRLFEVTGVGSCLVTDWKKNLQEIFDVDSEIVTYKSQEECIEKLRWLIDHPKECKEIAVRGQRRVLKDHTYKHRAALLHEIVQNQLKDSNGK
ncbi:MAG: glycosyltransferase [Bacteroidota bacterium]